MANGNGNGGWSLASAWKLFGLCITASMGMSVATVTIMTGLIEDVESRFEKRISSVEDKIHVRTADRYYKSDAERDHQWIIERLRMIEAHDDKLEKDFYSHIEKHNSK